MCSLLNDRLQTAQGGDSTTTYSVSLSVSVHRQSAPFDASLGIQSISLSIESSADI